jgi:hypothetical protein
MAAYPHVRPWTRPPTHHPGSLHAADGQTRVAWVRAGRPCPRRRPNDRKPAGSFQPSCSWPTLALRQRPRQAIKAFDLDISLPTLSNVVLTDKEGSMTRFLEPIDPPSPKDLRQKKDTRDPAVSLRLTDLWTRLIVGIIGIALPILFIIGESFFLRGGVHVRGSLSAYYHTSMRDIFVAGFCVTGFFLATYMSGQPKTPDFRLSLVAGLALIGVVFFPTMRPHLLLDAPRCGVTPMPQGCSFVQQQLGERLVAWVHFAFAAIFILSLAAICFFVFAKGEKERSKRPEMATDPRTATIVSACGWVILGAVAWAVIGGLLKVTIWELTPLYLGELISVWAFGAAWLFKARDLLQALGLRQPEALAEPRAGGPVNVEPPPDPT